MARIVRHVDWASLGPLDSGSWRCCLAFVRHGEVDITPVRAHRTGETFRVELAHAVLARLDLGSPVRLTFDGGTGWFELRAVTIRGRLVPPPFRDPDLDRIVCEVIPDAIGAWDYGTLRTESNGGGRIDD
jgi:hypothetical protein